MTLEEYKEAKYQSDFLNSKKGIEEFIGEWGSHFDEEPIEVIFQSCVNWAGYAYFIPYQMFAEMWYTK